MKKNKKRKEVKLIVTKTPRELAKALGLTPLDSKLWELRLDVEKKIFQAVKQKKISVTDLAKASKTSRSRITRILQKDIQGISLDVLIKVLIATGKQVKLSYKRVS